MHPAERHTDTAEAAGSLAEGTVVEEGTRRSPGGRCGSLGQDSTTSRRWPGYMSPGEVSVFVRSADATNAPMLIVSPCGKHRNIYLECSSYTAGGVVRVKVVLRTQATMM